MNDIYDIDAYQQYINSIPKERLTKEEEQKLIIEAHNGNMEARKILIERNLKLVISVAIKYKFLGVPMLDLIEEGNIGLMIAIDKYDFKYNSRLSTYAIPRIKQRIIVYLANNHKIVSLPHNMYNKYYKYQELKQELTTKLGRIPSDMEIANELKISVKNLRIFNEFDDIVHLDATILDEGKSYGEIIPDDIHSEEEIIRNIVLDKFREYLSNMELTPKEQYIITKRFNFDGEGIMTLEDIGNELGVSSEAIRQDVFKILDKFRFDDRIFAFADIFHSAEYATLNIYKLRREHYQKTGNRK